MPQVFEIDNTWTHQKWVNTGGTRAKHFLQSPDETYYYFKRSQFKIGKDYKYEFWSEIIASEIGNLLSFPMLEYNIAVYGEMVGCICKSMIEPEKEELIELIKYLQAFSPTYNPKLKEHKTWYTFQLIENSLERVKLKDISMPHVIEIIIFDALIGNGDRHQENMALINRPTLISEVYKEILEKKVDPKNWLDYTMMRLTNLLSDAVGTLKSLGEPIPKSAYFSKIKFAPIYDSGSSLGRELNEEKLNSILKNEAEFEAYINRGKSEIHWEGGLKLTHWEILERLMLSNYRELILKKLKTIQSKWDETKVREIVFNVDSKLPEYYNSYSIPLNRKEVIYKILTLRFKKLVSLLNA